MRSMSRRRPTSWLVAVLSVALLALPTGGTDAGAHTQDVRIEVLSNRADLVSGGDALVEIHLPDGTDPAEVTVEVDGRDVSDAFAVRANGRFMGLVAGLDEGESVLTAELPDGHGARITITNHPVGGPVFSGPQIEPWTCAEGAADEQCNRPPTYDFFYKSTVTGDFEDYDPEDPPPDALVAETTTDEGHTVPYVVRRETGVIDRDEYRIAVLFDPDEPWEPWAPQAPFNHKLVLTHGASCDTSYEQGEAPGVLNDTALSRGFAVASHALDNAGHNCNILTQAESLVMTKEHLVDTYGELRYTIGTGCSGGALVQYQVANAYPGVYQAITPQCSYPDAWSSAMQYEDYHLLRDYFEDPAGWEPGVVWTPADMEEVLGHPNPSNPITFTEVIPDSGYPDRSCPGVPDEDVYHPEDNPDGVRCTLHDYMVNLFGRRPPEDWGPIEQELGHGFANPPWDNTGVQYGLQGLLDGDLTPAQFVDVNTKIGGRDIDHRPIPERSDADPTAVERAYRGGAINTASNLDEVAIIDLRGPDPGAFHDVYRTYALRARLVREHGDAGNMAIWRGPAPLIGGTSFASEAILAADEWLAAVEADDRDVPLSQKLVDDRPESARDRCTEGTGQGAEIPEEPCDAVVDTYATPRIQAGMPFTDDVMKCRLKPLERPDYYPVQFTDEQWARLQEAFPDGVCDYTEPGVGQSATVPWLTYEGGPGGEPLGPPPTSEPL